MTDRSFDDIRREQVQEGGRMARDEQPSVWQRSHRPTIVGARPPGLKPKVKKVVGHEAFLKQLEASGTEVQFEKMSGEVFTGTIKCSDKYTVTVRVPLVNGDRPFRDRVLFKHDLSEFSSLAEKPAEVIGDE